MPQHDPRTLFEFLVLEGAQAGLSWTTILNKRDGYRAAFAGFDPAPVAAFDDADIARCLADPGIVRNRAKVAAAVDNARAWLALDDPAAHLWSFVGGRPVQNRFDESMSEIPAFDERAAAMSKDLKRRGFRFVGPTICYALMQACGLVNDHIVRLLPPRRVRRPGLSARHRIVCQHGRSQTACTLTQRQGRSNVSRLQRRIDRHRGGGGGDRRSTAIGPQPRPRRAAGQRDVIRHASGARSRCSSTACSPRRSRSRGTARSTPPSRPSPRPASIEYKYVDGLGTSDEMERGLRDIIETDDPDLIIGDAFAAEDAVRAVAADYPDTAFAFGSGVRRGGAQLQRVRQLVAGPRLPRRDARRRAHRVRHDRRRRGDADPRGQPHRQRLRHGRRRDERRRHGQGLVHQLVLRPGDRRARPPRRRSPRAPTSCSPSGPASSRSPTRTTCRSSG